jgi:hypothetical protein
MQWVMSCSMWVDRQAGGRADMTVLIVVFHNFANAPKNKLIYTKFIRSQNKNIPLKIPL